MKSSYAGTFTCHNYTVVSKMAYFQQTYYMPIGKKTDWSVLDDLIVEHLPHMTVTEFTKEHAPFLHAGTIRSRAKFLGVQYKPAYFALFKETPEIIEKIKLLRDTHSLNEISKITGLSRCTIWRITRRHNISLSEKGVRRWKEDAAKRCIGRKPWNKGGNLSQDTKDKISRSITNQYRDGSREVYTMSGESLEKWRDSYAKNGIHKMREWLKSPQGVDSNRRSILHSNPSKVSNSISKMIIDGEFIPYPNHHKHGWHDSPKAGKIYYRSSYELVYYKILDEDTLVNTYKAASIKIPYIINGARHNYIPDVMVFRDIRTSIVEIKPKNLVGKLKNPAKISAAQKYCIENGYEFEVITEDELGT